MFCSQCGAQVCEGNKFCTQCGTLMPVPVQSTVTATPVSEKAPDMPPHVPQGFQPTGPVEDAGKNIGATSRPTPLKQLLNFCRHPMLFALAGVQTVIMLVFLVRAADDGFTALAEMFSLTVTESAVSEVLSGLTVFLFIAAAVLLTCGLWTVIVGGYTSAKVARNGCTLCTAGLYTQAAVFFFVLVNVVYKLVHNLNESIEWWTGSSLSQKRIEEHLDALEESFVRNVIFYFVIFLFIIMMYIWLANTALSMERNLRLLSRDPSGNGRIYRHGIVPAVMCGMTAMFPVLLLLIAAISDASMKTSEWLIIGGFALSLIFVAVVALLYYSVVSAIKYSYAVAENQGES